MNILSITQWGNPILRSKTRQVMRSQLRTVRFQKLIKEMFSTVRKVQGVGLAAPQINRALQLAVIDIHPTKMRPKLRRLPKIVIINPKILQYSKEKEMGWEGCLSFAGVRGSVPRSKWVKVTYLDQNGERHTEVIHGFPATVFQHEIDHLNGKVYADRMQDMNTLITEEEFKKRILKR